MTIINVVCVFLKIRPVTKSIVVRVRPVMVAYCCRCILDVLSVTITVVVCQCFRGFSVLR